MDYEHSFIRPILVFYYEKGVSEVDAHKEISKQHGPSGISFKTIIKWYEYFRTRGRNIGDRKLNSSKHKFTDEYLINLVTENPKLNMRELGKLSETSASTISNRLKQVNTWGEKVKYCKYRFQKEIVSSIEKRKPIFDDNYLIDLIKNNPELSKVELAKISNSSVTTITNRLKQINSDSEKVTYVSKDFKMGAPKFSDDYLVNLISENPELNLEELGKLANTTGSTISRRLKQVNENRSSEDKIVLHAKTSKSRNRAAKYTDEFIINLINDNPSLNIRELAKLSGLSSKTISKRIKQINSNGEKVSCASKYMKNGTSKLTDEYLLNLTKNNPSLKLKELAKLANISTSTLSKRLKLINSDSQRANNTNEDYRAGEKLTDEFLINLVEENPDLNMKEIAELASSNKVTIARRLKQINKDGERVKYCKKNLTKGHKKFTDEYLINLINDNSELTMEELAKIADVSTGTISYRIKKININGERVKYHNKTTQSKGKAKLTDEFLIDLINKNPGLNMKELGNITNTSAATISIRLKKINKNSEKVKYINKRSKVNI
jgi:transcriptional antiterminator